MIRIPTSQNADSRTAVKKVSREELLDNSRQHIMDVATAMNWMAQKLMDAGVTHDYTKITNIKEFHDDFSAAQNGTLQGDFKEQHWFKDIHLQERHHLGDRCPDDVNLFDVLERIADGVTAGMARSGSVYEDSLSPEILEKAYQNTMKLLQDQIIVVEK